MKTLLILPISFLLNIFLYNFNIDIFFYLKKIIFQIKNLLKEKVYKDNEVLELVLGILICLVFILISFIIPFFLLKFLYNLHFLLGFFIELAILYFILGIRKPLEISSSIYDSLKYVDLNFTKNMLKDNLNIDVYNIDKENIIKRTIEYSSISAAEDYIYTSIFFLFGGIKLCLVYKVLCLLSEVLSGNDTIIDENRVKDKFSMFSVRASYIVNIIPSMFTFLSYTIADFILGYDIKKCFKVFKRDGNDNKARVECAVAGALEIELGGEYSKNDLVYNRILVGDAINNLEAAHIVKSNKIIIIGSIIALSILIILKLLSMVFAALFLHYY